MVEKGRKGKEERGCEERKIKRKMKEAPTRQSTQISTGMSLS